MVPAVHLDKPRGYHLRTGARRLACAEAGPVHRLAGPRAAHPDVCFPRCPSCGELNSPIVRLDFADERLAELRPWRGVFVALACLNGCRPRDASRRLYAWSYADPRAPHILEPDSLERGGGGRALAQDWEFEHVALRLEPRYCDAPDGVDTQTRVGGEPAWWPLDLDDDGPGCATRSAACPRCERAMRFLLQWSEAGLQTIPRRIGSTRPEWMASGSLRSWFACDACRVVATLDPCDG